MTKGMRHCQPFLLSLRAKRGNPGESKILNPKSEILNNIKWPKSRSPSSGFCSCLIHQAQLPNKLGNYIFELGIAEPVPSKTRNPAPRNDRRGCALVQIDRWQSQTAPGKHQSSDITSSSSPRKLWLILPNARRGKISRFHLRAWSGSRARVSRYFSFADEGLIEKYDLDFLSLRK